MKLLNRTVAIVIASAVTATIPVVAECADIGTVLREASRDGIYRQPGDQELLRAEDLFSRTLKGEPAAALKEGWRKLNFEMLTVSAGNGEFLLLREKEGYRTGRGFFLVRRGGIPLLLQMPHSFKDEQTRRIGLDMVMEGRCTTAAWNTVPRWYDENGSRIDADLAHHPHSYFTALTRAFLRVTPRGTVAQLHGFDGGKRTSRSGAGADVIISSGSKNVTTGVRKASSCISRGAGAEVLVYPADIRELGGTTNSIGLLMESLGSSSFIHLEMSDGFRSRLRKDRSLRAVMNQCLEEATR